MLTKDFSTDLQAHKEALVYTGHRNKLKGLHKDQAALEVASAKADSEKISTVPLRDLC